MRWSHALPAAAVIAAALACSGIQPEPEPVPEPTGPTAAEAKAFVTETDARLFELFAARETSLWNYETDIKPETEAVSAAAQEAVMAFMSESIPKAVALQAVPDLDKDTARQLQLLKNETRLPAPADPALRKELAEIATRMSGTYGKGKYCTNPADETTCKDLGDLSEILATNRDPAAQLEAWNGWHTISPPMRADYQRFVELGNQGARELGYADMGVGWRSTYDMTPAEFEAEVDRLWTEVEPLYKQLHCYTRARLNETYGDAVVPKSGPIPAHLTGNMWAQDWTALYPMLEPHPGQPSLDVTAMLKAKNTDPVTMVKTAEAFFTSVGLESLPPSFWERSMLSQPEGREVECHASAWDLTYRGDVRIKMCIKPTMEDLVTIHHELGHIYYYLDYHELPALYQNGANDGFHEAIGDAIALSITPSYLHQIGLLDEVSESDEAVLNKQMLDALDKVTFLPFGRMIDQWRWDVFSGKIAPDAYNAGWWQLRGQYQGIAPPTPRGEEFFDAGAKYHIPGNTPYARYFLAYILQFQFHKAMCEAAGHTGPLHTCSVYGSKEAGAKLHAMLEMGASEPWPVALEAMTGTPKMSAEPLVEYFGPLSAYLAEQNKDRECGW